MFGEAADDATLHRLTTISRKFCDVLAPMYFKRCGLELSRESRNVSITTPQQIVALHVWRRSSFFQKVDRFSLRLSLTQSVADEQADRIRLFFETCRSTIFTDTLSIILPYQHTAADLAVLQSVTGCKDLHVFFSGAPAIFPLTNMPRITANSWTPPHQRPIHFNTLLMPVGLLMSQFRPWTIAALNTDLTGLDFSLLKMSPELWRQFLRQIRIPTLLKFHVSGDAPVASIVSFLSRHDHIQQLRITQTMIYHPADIVSLSTLPASCLSDLSGPARFVQQISRRLSSSVHLEWLTILPDARGLSFQSVKRILGYPACDQLKYLSISLPADAAVSVLDFDVQNVDSRAFSPQLKDITFSSDDIVFDDDILVSSCNFWWSLAFIALHRMDASNGYHCFPTSESSHCTITHVPTTTRNHVLGALQIRRGEREHHPIWSRYSLIAAPSSVFGPIGVIVAYVYCLYVILLYSTLVHTIRSYLVQRSSGRTCHYIMQWSM